MMYALTPEMVQAAVEARDKALAEDCNDQLSALYDALRAALAAAPLEDSPAPVSQSALDVLQERARQHQREGFSLDHDLNLNPHGDLALAGAAYAIHAANPTAQIDIKVGVGGWLRNGGWCGLASLVWPKHFDRQKWWKPGSAIAEYDPRRCLVKAAALILAEIDRYDYERSSKAAERVHEAES